MESPDFVNILSTDGGGDKFEEYFVSNNNRNAGSSFSNHERVRETNKAVEMARLNTPKPVIYLGSATEFQRQGSAIGVPKTPYRGTADHSRSDTGFKPTTNFKMPVASGQRGIKTPAFRPGTSSSVNVNRPMTAVRGAGYTSHGGGKPFDPLNQAAGAPTPPLELQKDDSPEYKIRVQKNKIMALIEEACVAEGEGNFRKSLTKAKEASNKERALIRIQEQSELGDLHDVDLTFVVLFTLGNQYAANDLHTEALSTYQMIIKNRTFSQAHRLKVNMGNIYFKQGQYQLAVKLYRMALDQVSSSQKNLRIKIMHNIALVFIKMGQWEEAISSLEYIMSEQACHRAGLHLVLCCRALDDRDRMKTCFLMLLGVSLDVEDEDKYNLEQDNPDDVLFTLAIQNDDLHVFESRKRKDAEYCILTAAKIIAPLIEDTFSLGYDWCVSSIKKSEYARLATDLEINKAVMFLKQKQMKQAIDTLKAFEKDSVIALNAAINLSFIYFLQGDLITATRYAEVVKVSTTQGNLAEGYVNLGACLFASETSPKTNNYEDAITCFRTSLDHNPTHFEAIYNLGLVLKKQGHYSEALECFQRFSGSLSLMPCVMYQIANLLELKGDTEAAADMYQQLLGLCPMDSNVLQKLGELYDQDGDKQQAHHYHLESFRYYPANLSVVNWLGSYYIEMQVVEKALVYFEKAAQMQPNEPKWNMMVAGCHRRSGNMHKALTLYQEIHKQFPENVECLRFLVRLCNDLAMREAQNYIMELKKLEKAREVKERINSSRPDSRRSTGSNSGLSSRGGSEEHHNHQRSSRTSRSKMLRGSSTSNVLNHQNSAGSEDSGYSPGQQQIDLSYSDPLGPQALRPRTGVAPPGGSKLVDFEGFGNDELGDDLLPE